LAAIPAYIQVINQIKNEWISGDELPSGNKLPTQEELADRFGVSRSTIVRALSQLTAEGFLYSQQGSGVYISENQARASNLQCLSMIVPELGPPLIVAVCKGVEKRVRQMGFQVLIASSEYRIQREKELIEQHVQAGSKGIILYPVTRNRSDLETDYLVEESQSVPLVTIDIACEEWRCSKVIFDNYHAAYDMTQMLMRHGHRRIAFMHTHPDRLHSSIHDREKGWRAAMQEACLEIPNSYKLWPVPLHDFSNLLKDGDYIRIAHSLLALRPCPDAVIAWTDGAAANLIQALLHIGISVPEQIRVTGFDNDPMVSRLIRPLFPTTTPDFVRLGEIAVDVLKSRMASERKELHTYCYSVPVSWRDIPDKLTSSSAALEGKTTALTV
jgi:GntR family transcriptional regulator of arabinose operon